MLVPLTASPDRSLRRARAALAVDMVSWPYGHPGIPRRGWIGGANQDVYMHRGGAKAIANQSQLTMRPRIRLGTAVVPV